MTHMTISTASATPTALNPGRLNNGNPSGDYMTAPRCGAKTRMGSCCAQPAMRNGRCRFHGGKSTGAWTTAGRARCARARRTHGFYSAEVVALRAEARAASRRVRDLPAALRARPAGHGALPAFLPAALDHPRSSACIWGSNSSAAPDAASEDVVPAGHGVLSAFLRFALERAARLLGLLPRASA